MATQRTPTRTAKRKKRSRFGQPVRRAVGVGTALVCGLATLGALQFMGPLKFAPAPFAAVLGGVEPTLGARASKNAFGASMGVALREAMPAESLEFPLDVSSDPEDLEYRWVPVGRSSADTVATRPLEGSTVVAPEAPGVYRLALSQGGIEQVIAEPAVAVLVPFAAKIGGFLNGYRIGTYVAERLGQRNKERPDGFIEVTEDMLDLAVSRHFRIRDFITHDQQDDVWPKYVALDPRLLDKLELVLTRLARYRGLDSLPTMALDVHSGFRTPAYNRKVQRSAKDSRHQYGDAADVVIDADRDGRITQKDGRLVAKAVDEIEAEYPHLVGGMGMYTSRKYRTPYVHIDARGKRSRWRG
ncbi:MAG: D-Ala-D-Ala carboxypeptidase family metallohydrolase [Gemmatimonadaceae bacterium]